MAENPYSTQNNPFDSAIRGQDSVQVGGGNMQGAESNIARQRLSSMGGKGGKGGKGGGAWRMIIKAALGGIGGGMTGAANANSNTNNPFGSGFGNSSQDQNPFSGGGR